MLIVQPTSTCDVCLDRYAWDAPASESLSKPHVITCGHVFCHQCLQNLRIPRTCPLCRASFHLTRAVKIHVDLASDDAGRHLTAEEAEARRFELRIAEISLLESSSQVPSVTTTSEDGPTEGDGERTTTSEDLERQRALIVEEALAFLDNAPPESHPILRNLLASINAQQTLSESLHTAEVETLRMRSERDHARRYLRRAERAREQEVALAKSAEKNWMMRVAEVERDCEIKLTEAAAERQRLQDELAHYKLSLKDAQAAQSDILVQAHMQIRDQSQNAVAAPPYSPPSRTAPVAQDQPASPAVAASTSSVTQQSQSQSQPKPYQQTQPQAGPSTAASSSEIAFPRTSSPSPSTYEYEYEYTHNPLPRPPEPVPLSRLPAFARPRPGSSAYTAARALARHAHRHEKRAEESDRDKGRDREKEREARRERRKEKERERARETEDEKERKERRERRKERERAREREMKGVGSDSGKEHRRTREGKEKDRGTDTSATETQERLKAARKHHTSRQSTSEQPSGSALTNGAAYMNEIEAPVPDQPNGKAIIEVNGVAPMPAAVPRDVVGGWGLERSWRASLASNSSDASGPASYEDLYAPHRDATGVAGAGAVGSSHTRMRVREEKDKEKEKKTDKVKGKGKEKETDALEPVTDDIKDDFVFVASAHEEREKERERHISFASYPSASNNILPRPPQSQTPAQAQWKGRERERRTTLSAAPSALGLVLVPSPDGRGGYEYQYQYQYRFPQQSTIQTGSAASGTTLGGKESITPLASLLNSNNQHNGYFFGSAPEMHSRASTASNATLTRRATDSQLQAQAQAHAYGVYPTLRHPRAPSTAPLHVPQPRRVSLTIPEPPESEPESIRSQTRTQPQPQAQTQTQQSFRGGIEPYVNSGYPNVESWRDAFSQQQQQQRTTAVESSNENGGSGGFYANSNPSANMSLDSALASMSLAAAASTSSSNHATGSSPDVEVDGGPQQTLRHRTSNSSTASASTGISLTGTTSGERRKQLLDALFMGSSTGTDTNASTSNRSSYASNGSFDGVVANTGVNRMSLGRTLDANTTITSTTAGPSNAGVAKTDPSTSTQGQNVVVAPVAQKPVVPPAPRGVPSRDGRPSRGLDMSTRPSTTQPIQTVQANQTQVPVLPAYPATLQAQTTSHARQATYPPGTYTSSTMAYATIPHAQTQGGQSTYGSNAPYPYSSYPASAYYQSQPQAHGASTTTTAAAAATATATQATRFANYTVAPAAVASAQDHR